MSDGKKRKQGGGGGGGGGAGNGFKPLGLSDSVYRGIVKMGFRVRESERYIDMELSYEH